MVAVGNGQIPYKIVSRVCAFRNNSVEFRVIGSRHVIVTDRVLHRTAFDRACRYKSPCDTVVSKCVRGRLCNFHCRFFYFQPAVRSCECHAEIVIIIGELTCQQTHIIFVGICLRYALRSGECVIGVSV